MSKENNTYDVNAPSVILHLSMVQEVIKRMANNSMSMKMWFSTGIKIIVAYVTSSNAFHRFVVFSSYCYFCGLGY
ncbi:hypothetical protein [Candidatus Liberibacter sp.]|uniref:hypothetical protein n=1 Tax=Candidatus Liberibacter sp. TaxID=34022 RepID=UPI0015F6E46F|nr:hypothetical protein [Candidatus Liberibacter sp.]MBA5724496.1 hypothetical protein [Candidatus Liberibacter sp.]